MDESKASGERICLKPSTDDDDEVPRSSETGMFSPAKPLRPRKALTCLRSATLYLWGHSKR